jgi:hypothetical protein
VVEEKRSLRVILALKCHEISFINIYSIEYLDGRRSAELFRNLNKESKNRMKLLKMNSRHLQREIYTERLRYLQNEELELKTKVELGPEKFRFKVVDEIFI